MVKHLNSSFDVTRVNFDNWVDLLRDLMIKKWSKMVRQEILRWYLSHGCNHPDRMSVWKAGREAIAKASKCS